MQRKLPLPTAKSGGLFSMAPALLFSLAVKNYDLQVGGQLLWNKTSDEVEELFFRGRVRRDTACRVSGTDPWRDVNEFFPLLKYERSPLVRVKTETIEERPPSPAIVDVERDDHGRPGLTSALKAGWICFGIGAAAAWIFPPAYLFYSVALILAVVAMCTRQVNRGLILLLSSFVGMGASALMFFLLAGGLFVHAVAPAVAQANRDLEESRAIQQKALNDLHQAQRNLSKSLGQTMQPPPVSRPFTPVARQSPPPVVKPGSFENMNQRELFLEIARLENQQRELRKQGRDLPQVTRDYLARLQAAHDRAAGGK